VRKVRHRAGATRRYDTAKTPCQQLLASDVLPSKVEARLAAQSRRLDPLRLNLQLEAALWLTSLSAT